MTDHESEAGLKLEIAPEIPSPQDLHNRFIPGDLVPPGQPSSEDETIELTIDNDYTMHLGEYEIVLGGLEIYVFNALLLLRGRQPTASELRSLGFTTTSTSPAAIRRAFNDAYENLVEQLNVNGNQPLVAAEGDEPESAQFYVNPNLVVTDKRSDEPKLEERIYTAPKREVADFVIKQTMRRERKEVSFDGDLYERLLTLDRLPDIPLAEGASPIEIEIVDNTTLRVGDQIIHLGAHERYLFNALMLLREEISVGPDLRAFGFYPGSKDATANQAFSKTVSSLLGQLNEAAGIEIIKKIGERRGTRYAVNPSLLLTDIRTDEDLAREISDIRGGGTSSPEHRELEDQGDLYQRLIDLGRIPSMKIGEDGAIELAIVDNTTLKGGGHTITLGRHERYLFNALMLLREIPASGSELRQFGFFPGAKDNTASMTFSKEMTSLIQQLNEALGVEIFKKVGVRRNMRYAVNPNLVLADLRSDEDKDAPVIDVQKKRGRPSKYQSFGPKPKSSYRGPSFEGEDEEADHYDDNERRILLITELIQKYKDHPLVAQAIGKLNNGAPIGVGPEQPYYRYLGEINQYDLLEAADEVRLFRVLEKGLNAYRDHGATPENEQTLIGAVIARQIVYVANLRLVIEHAKTKAFYNKKMGLLDFVQEGNIGLADAIDRFDYRKGFKFSTYATWWVRQHMQRSEADKGRMIRIPVHMHDRLVKFSKTVRELTEDLDRDPNPWEIAYKLEEPVSEVLKLQHYSQLEPASLNALIEDSGKGSRDGVSERIDQIPDPNDEIAKASQEAEDTAVVEELFSKRNLTQKERYVLSFRLGFVVESLKGTTLDFGDGTVLPYSDLIEQMADT